MLRRDINDYITMRLQEDSMSYRSVSYHHVKINGAEVQYGINENHTRWVSPMEKARKLINPGDILIADIYDKRGCRHLSWSQVIIPEKFTATQLAELEDFRGLRDKRGERRDNQKGKVYDWENRCFVRSDRQTSEQIAAQLEDIAALYGMPWVPNFEINYRKDSVSQWLPWRMKIELAPGWGTSTVTVAHEAAHAVVSCAGGAKKSHGPEFVSVDYDLLNIYCKKREGADPLAEIEKMNIDIDLDYDPATLIEQRMHAE